jgi:hypothetical protein
MYWILLTIAAVIITVLCVAAAYYLLKLNKLKQEQKRHIQINQDAWLKAQEELASDIRFLANSLVSLQCEITEGCLRIMVLMTRLDEKLPHDDRFKTMLLHYQETHDMPHHQAYKALNRKQQYSLDQARFALEDKHREQILTEAKDLSTYQFNSPI